MAFKKGQSGNPAERKRGSRNTATVTLEDLLKGQGEALVQRRSSSLWRVTPAILKLCLERLYPARRGRGVEIRSARSPRSQTWLGRSWRS